MTNTRKENERDGSNELLITDLRCALPAEAWTDAESTIHKWRSAPPPSGKWRIIDYKSQRFSGSCLWTSHADAAVLRIPLGRKGWHAVSIGLAHPWQRRTFVEVRLTGEKDWHIIEGYTGLDDNPYPLAEPTHGGRLHEEPWIFADLTGKDLEIRFPVDYPRGHRDGGRCALYSVRATPVRPEDLAAVTTRRHYPLVQNLESIHQPDHARWDNDQWDVICSNNNILNHPFDLNAFHHNWPHEPWDEGVGDMDIFRNTIKDPLEAGRDIVREAIEAAHRRVRRFWYAMRPVGWGSAAALDQFTFVRFFAEHPEYRCREADGAALGTLSIAFPQVRAWLNEHLGQWLRRGADGINLILVRGYPLVRYEDPVARLFCERNGADIRTVGDRDVRLSHLWADLIAVWLRELRRLLDEAGPTALSPRRQLTVYAGPSLEWNRQFGFDVAGWAREGLLDAVLPYPTGSHHTARLYGDGYDRPSGWIDVAGYREALQGTTTEIIPSLGDCVDHWLPLATYRRRAHRFYEEGATGLCRWDNSADPALAGARLDDPVIQALWCKRYLVDQDNWLTEMQGFNVERFEHGIAY